MTDALAEARAGMMMRLEARTKDGTEWVPVYPAQVEMFSSNGAIIRAFECDPAPPLAAMAGEPLPLWQQMQFDLLLGKLSDWRNDDHEDSIAIFRSDVIAILDGVKALTSTPQPSPLRSDVTLPSEEDVAKALFMCRGASVEEWEEERARDEKSEGGTFRAQACYGDARAVLALLRAEPGDQA